MGAPMLPQQVSPSGRELWDWATRFSDHIHRRDEIARLTREIAQIGRTCGDCYSWMKSRECPREKNVGGISRGPSCKEPICKQFVETSLASARRKELQGNLLAISATEEKGGE